MKRLIATILSIFIVITTIIAPVYAFKGNSGGYDWLDKQYGKWTKDLRDPKTGVLKSGVEVTAKSSKGLVSKIIKNPSTLRTAKFLAGGIGYRYSNQRDVKCHRFCTRPCQQHNQIHTKRDSNRLSL